MAYLLFTRLIACGHQSTDIRPLFLEATEWLENRYDSKVDQSNSTNLDSSSNDVLFFHISRDWKLHSSAGAI